MKILIHQKEGGKDGLHKCFSNFLARGPFWLRKITTDPHILIHVSIQGPADRHP